MPTQLEISLNPTSAAGDILSSNGSSRIRFPTSTTSNQILTAVSSASSGLEWRTYGAALASEPIMISTSTTAAGSVTSFTVSNIPQTYTDLKVIIISATGSWDGSNPCIRINGSATTGFYSRTGIEKYGTTAVPAAQLERLIGTALEPGNNVGSQGLGGQILTYEIMNYANTSSYKPVIIHNASGEVPTASNRGTTFNVATYRSTSAVTSINFISFTNNAYSKRVVIYGIKRQGQ